MPRATRAAITPISAHVREKNGNVTRVPVLQMRTSRFISQAQEHTCRLTSVTYATLRYMDLQVVDNAASICRAASTAGKT